MAKTEEEILSERLGRRGTHMWASAIAGAKEFAAQEVEAYKERLKKEMVSEFYGIKDEIIKVIDAVK